MAKEYVEWKFLFDVNLLIYILKIAPLILNKKNQMVTLLVYIIMQSLPNPNLSPFNKVGPYKKKKKSLHKTITLIIYFKPQILWLIQF